MGHAISRLRVHNGAFAEPFFCVGVNYHPSDTGCQYWQRWRPERLDADFAQMAAAGLNTVRFFIFWADFEPRPGEYDEVMFGRLRELVAIAARHGLRCLPSLLTIWMNGQHFDPVWRNGRDLWRDPELVERAAAFVGQVASALADADNVLAYDLGDEIVHVNDEHSGTLSAAEVRAWWSTMAGSIRAADPAAVVLQATDGSALTGGHQFRPEHAVALDLVGLHGFPVWTPFEIEAVASVKATHLVPYLVRHGRAKAPVLVDEIGSYGCDEQTAAEYLRAAAYGALAAGACGVIAWCWQDFATAAKPYADRPNERTVGLTRVDGDAKPALTEFTAFARVATGTGRLAGFRPQPAPVGIVGPDVHGDAHASYLATSTTNSAAGAFYAHMLCAQAQLPHEYAGDDLHRYQFVVCPSVTRISLADQERLADFVRAGGTLLYSCGDLLNGFGGEELFGIRQVDFTLSRGEERPFTYDDVVFPVRWGVTQVPVIAAVEAKVLAEFADGTPALTRHEYGRGVAYYVNAPFERQLNEAYRLETAPWHRLYAAIATDAGVDIPARSDHPEVEVVVLRRGTRQRAVVINHAAHPVRTTISGTRLAAGEPTARTLTLPGKGVRILRWHR